MNEAQRHDFQEILNKLVGVLGANVIISDQKMEEIHILADLSRHPKQISRDVQSVYAARFGKTMNHKQISIAQIQVEKKAEICGRIQIEGVQHQIDNDGLAQARVALKHMDVLHEGRAQGPHTSRNTNRLVVDATLRAVSDLLGLKNPIVLEDVQSLCLAGKRSYVVALCALNDYSEEIYIGSAIVKKDEKIALVKATLDAINRRLTMLVK